MAKAVSQRAEINCTATSTRGPTHGTGSAPQQQRAAKDRAVAAAEWPHCLRSHPHQHQSQRTRHEAVAAVCRDARETAAAEPTWALHTNARNTTLMSPREEHETRVQNAHCLSVPTAAAASAGGEARGSLASFCVSQSQSQQRTQHEPQIVRKHRKGTRRGSYSAFDGRAASRVARRLRPTHTHTTTHESASARRNASTNKVCDQPHQVQQ